jgi:thiol:disulfide interchange protein DsbA
MNKLAASLLSTLLLVTLTGCGDKDTGSQPAPSETTETVEAPVVQTVPDTPASESAAEEETEQSSPETVSETNDEAAPDATASTSVQPPVRLGAERSGPPTSARFKEGTHYQKIVPAQPTNAAPGKVEVAEVFWYGCAHCFTLDPALESWRAKAPNYVEFTRIPAMWNDATRMHARLFYTAESLGKLEELHAPIFREIHVNGNQLNTVEKIAALFKQHGVSAKQFEDAFSSFTVMQTKLQRADFLNRRYRVQSVPLMIVNGKYSLDLSSAGSEADLFALLDELAAHESGN